MTQFRIFYTIIFFFNDTATTEIYTLSLHDALPICFIVTEGIHDRFVEAMTERMQRLVLGDALKPETEIGPVVDRNQLDQDLSYIRIGQDEGAKLAAGGNLVERDTRSEERRVGKECRSRWSPY